ncbi:uncharacterized protein LOC129577107 [Sitodiplosis mosellana]|uniref:uncharacterized protein LOC129577107 n=1 Tax=Sitodiplosis mosellana TaxID=263140 RepID=UPI002443E87F|nr:uncharacterized protein LOC129577107 [Sitodiplosis mosellana]
MLKLCKVLLEELCLWPLATSPSMNKRSIFRYAVNLSIETTVLTTTLIYVLQNLQNIDEATEPGFACFAYATSMFIYVWMISKKHLISSSIDHLECCVNERTKFNADVSESNERTETEAIYEQAEQQYTKLSRRYILSWSVIVCLYAFILTIIPVSDMWHGQTDASNWPTLFKSVYPLDSRKMSTFSIHYTLDFMAVFVHVSIYAASSTFHMATAQYVSAMILDTTSILQRCDINTTTNDLKLASVQDVTINNTLNKAVDLHANVLALTKVLLKIMSGVLFIIIINSIIFCALCLFQMETKTKAGAFEVYVSLNSVTLQGALIWFFCYHSALVAMRMGEVSNVAYALPWYHFSITSQKGVMMMLRQSNKHFAYRGFGILQCDLQTLKMMINSVVSYYLLLKKM